MHESPKMMHRTLGQSLRVLNVGFCSAPRGKRFPPHSHACWELAYYRSGSIRCTIDGAELETAPGTLLITPPKIVHSEAALTAYENLWVSVDAPPDVNWPRVLQDDRDRQMGEIFAWLLREWHDDRVNRSDMIGCLLWQLDILIRRQAGGIHLSAGEQAVARAEEFMETHFASKPSMEQIAKAAGLAPSTLREYFYRYRGHAPGEHLRRLRLRYALSLLRGSNMKLDAIAELCGYDSASHMSRHVKRATAMSPGCFRSASTSTAGFSRN